MPRVAWRASGNGAISAGGFHTVGVRSDATAVALGYDNCGQCDVSRWNDPMTVPASGPALTTE